MALLAAVFLVLRIVLVAPCPACALEDGVYEVDAQVLRAADDTPSVADAALEKPLELVVQGSKSYLVADIRPVTTSGLTGYLGFLWYYPTQHGAALPQDAEPVPIAPQEYYDVTDDFNAGADADAAVQGMNYPKTTVFEVDTSYSQVWIQVYVPLVEALSAGGGTQRARLVVDYGSARAVSDAARATRAQAAFERYLQMELSGTDALYAQLVDARMKLLQSARSAQAPVSGGGTAAPGQNTGSATPRSSSARTPGSRSRKLDFSKLPDGSYAVYGEMIKADRSSLSVSDGAIEHNVRIRVRNGRYTVELTFKPLRLSGKTGALGQLWYFKTGYGRDSSGAPTGSYARAKTLSRLSIGDGQPYPKKVSFPLISEARSGGWVPLRLYVPVIESVSKGAGVQTAWLRLDTSTLTNGAKAAARPSEDSASSVSSVPGAGTSPDATADDGETDVSALLAGAADDGSDGGDDGDVGGDPDEGTASDQAATPSSASAASAPAGTEANQEPPLKRYVGLIIGIPALLACLACLWALFTHRTQIAGLRRHHV